MIRVSNHKCIWRLGLRTMRASRSRNFVAVFGIILTTMLFTSLFTIALSITDSMQQVKFRETGSTCHGSFHNLSWEQVNELKNDPLIKKYGVNQTICVLEEAPFDKTPAELNWCDKNGADFMYLTPDRGHLPKEGTLEAAADTRVLSLLGIQPEIGASFSLPVEISGILTTQTFTLCGIWEYDENIRASHILISKSRAAEMDSQSNGYNLEVQLKNSSNIRKSLGQILENHGYQGNDGKQDNYIYTTINAGYLNAQLSDILDAPTAFALFLLLLLILLTGYLIIYNIFQISIMKEIRFYGLLKTIGTTSRQIGNLILQQAFLLSLFGIPMGLLAGWFMGAKMTPAFLTIFTHSIPGTLSVHPSIFIFSALFSLITVLISCRRPGQMAKHITPIESIHYTEGNTCRKSRRQHSENFSLFSMAWANLFRSRKRAAITILSLSLSVVLLHITVTFTNGFDTDKYFADKVSDFILADTRYFQVGGDLFNPSMALSNEVVSDISSQNGITDGGRIYGLTNSVQEFVSEDYFRQKRDWLDTNTLNQVVKETEQNSKGRLADDAQLYGMEHYPLSRLTLLKGDIKSLEEPGTRNIAAAYQTDDDGTVEPDSNWAKLGDTLTLRYVDEYECYDPDTDAIYGKPEDVPNGVSYLMRAVKYQDITYTISALVSIPSTLSYRYSGSDEFILNDQTFIKDTQTSSIMLYAFDTTETSNYRIENFLKNYISSQNHLYDYESTSIYTAEFKNFRSVFQLLGGVLSSIIGLVGILNFFNAILSSIITRKHEFAMLESIGMTKKQLKTMLVWEGLLYTLGAITLTLLLAAVFNPIMASIFGTFWFFTYHFTIMPILLIVPLFALIGTVIPLAVCRSVSKHTVVERLRSEE